MTRKSAIFIALLTAFAVAAGGAVAKGGHGKAKGKVAERVFTLSPDPAGNPEGIAYSKRTRSFFVSITADGAIYRGTLGSDTVSPFIPGGAGKAAVGIKVRGNRLYVAGGPTGTLTVYDLKSKQPVATFNTGAGGFLNDLVVTRNGDVWVTDSFRPTLWHVTARQVRDGGGTPQAIDLSGASRPPRASSTRTASSRATATASWWSTRRPASCSGSTCATGGRRSTTSRASACPAATACCATAAGSSWCRATRRS